MRLKRGHLLADRGCFRGEFLFQCGDFVFIIGTQSFVGIVHFPFQCGNLTQSLLIRSLKAGLPGRHLFLP